MKRRIGLFFAISCLACLGFQDPLWALPQQALKGWMFRFVALAAPHHGTVLARLGLGANARQMQVGSAWLEQLNRAPLPPIPIVSIWSTGDEVVAPQDSSQLAGAKEIVLPAMGHVAFAFSETVVDLVDAELVG